MTDLEVRQYSGLLFQLYQKLSMFYKENIHIFPTWEKNLVKILSELKGTQTSV